MSRLRPVLLVLALTCIGLALTGQAGAAGAESAPSTGIDDPLVAAGEDLYRAGCASCHGTDGAGVRIVEPADGIGDEAVTNAAGIGELRGPSLRESGAAGAYYYLSTGRMPLANSDDQPRRKDPAYDEAEIDALVAYVASLGDGPAIPEVDIDGADVAEGGVLFRANCQACHSAFGSGGALSYGRAAPSLHSSDPTEVGAAIRVGPGQMPVFGDDTITDEELDDVAAYVEVLRTPDNPGGLQIGRNGPVPEGFVIWLFGIGGLLLVVVWIGGRSPISARTSDEEVS
ncbi:cytochrome bc1 complex diheme cytochrome c subunit [Actinospongicola halichondriae]|uniref:cytochrome bc1 complex diheme cytochrome c subunit n=1 Tax=Actinospongicola halichondriae TaxID=3236844 RepID=UPI003D3BFED6